MRLIFQDSEQSVYAQGTAEKTDSKCCNSTSLKAIFLLSVSSQTGFFVFFAPIASEMNCKMN